MPEPVPVLRDLSTFSLSFEESGDWGCPEIHGSSNGQYFTIAYTEGFDCSNGAQDTNVPFEPETFGIEWVESLRSKNLGTSVMAFCLDYAKSRNFEVARMAVVNPRIITILEKLLGMGKIQERYYLLSDSTEGMITPEGIKPLPTTESFRYSVDLLSPEQALEYLDEDVDRSEDDPIAVWSAIYF